MQNVHSNLKLKSPENDEMSQEKSFLQRNETVEMHDIKVGHKNVQNKSKKLKCNKCPYTSYGQHNLMRHITAVHDKIKNHVCDECGYEASEKRTLISHRASVHKIGDHKFKCDKCPYKSNHSANLKKRIQGVHDKIRNHVCKVCGFATSWKGTLNRHRATVHCKKV